MKKYLIFLFLFVYSITFLSQEIPPIISFSTDDYEAENQNWAISQSDEKYIYIANNKGLLEFNGEDWQLYPTPNETILRSVKCYKNLVFTGFFMDFGYWKKNNLGKLEYTSLVNNNNFSMLEDEQIWEIEVLDDWIVFKSLQRIFLYNLITKNTKIYNGENNIIKLSKVNNTIYFQEIGKGVFSMESGNSKLISDAPELKDNLIVNIFEKNGDILFLTQKNGFYILKNGVVKQWNINASKFLENETIYSALQLSNEGFILGTISNGIIQLDENGNIKYQINTNNGLKNNTVLSIFNDMDSNIWLGLDNGINVINSKSPFKIFSNSSSLSGTVYASVIHNSYLYIGTNQGLYVKKNNSKDEFIFIENTEGQVWNLQIVNGDLFCSHDSGTFIIKDKKALKIPNTIGSWCVQKINNTTLLQGNYNGLEILKKRNNKWILSHKIEGFKNSSRYIATVNQNTVLVNHEYKGVYKLKLDNNFTEALKVEKDTTVKRSITSSLIRYKNQILYTNKIGIYNYNVDKNIFEKDTILSQLIPQKDFLSAKIIFDEKNNRLWSFTKSDIRYLSPNQFTNKPTLHKIPVEGYIFKGASGYENLLPLNNSEYLIGTSNGYLVLDTKKININDEFKISFTKAFVSKLDKPEYAFEIIENKKFKNTENNIKLFFSVPNYNKTSLIRYQYKLDGFNEKWSNKLKNNFVLFENLPFGDYTLKVRAFVDNKQSSNTASFTFTIQKPWYLSNLMVVIYVLVSLFVLLVLHYFYRRYFRRQREKILEKSQRELELKELENKQKITKLNNDKLRNDIESKNRELATSTMSIIKKNEFLNTIKNELLTNGKDNLDKVVSIIDKNLNNTDDWKLFQEAFNNADKKFLKKIKDKHPNLTPNDLRLCAYLRLNLSSKEIAPLLNISPRSVEVKRYRLRKKMELEHDVNLTDYILEI